MNKFELVSKFKPGGSQPDAIRQLVSGLKKGYDYQTLLGVTGSGKTFTIANVIQEVQKPTLVIAHNKTLAAQLCNELRELFPKNSVNYFVSYYDYYQPEAYMPNSDTYIGKESMVNEEIDKLRHEATVSLLTRKDVIVVASVSCIYGLGAPTAYAENIYKLTSGMDINRAEFSKRLVTLQYSRISIDLKRGNFRLRGENWEIMPPGKDVIYSFEVKNGKIQKIYEVDPILGFQPGKTPEMNEVIISPVKHFITPKQDMDKAIVRIQQELKDRLKFFEKNGKLLEAERLERRTKFDLAMMREIGYCNGIENYSQPISGRNPGEPPETLLDYFPKTESGAPDFLTVIDESHVTVPQLNGMHAGDASRKETLVEYGFRLPSAKDNRPLRFQEFKERIGQTIFTSATPAKFEYENSKQIVEQIIRPTGLLDPEIEIKPVKGQVDDAILRIKEIVEKKERILVTTLTKKMAEDLSSYLSEKNIKVSYLHSDVKTLDRIKILTNLRKGNFDCLVGVNLLREGLDLPEVSLVLILDADKEGFLRSETSLTQTIGRAARNSAGKVILYADSITGSIEKAVSETKRRRALQEAYNKLHNITPQTIIKEIKDILPAEEILKIETMPLPKSKRAMAALIKEKEREMKIAAEGLDFELATILRDEIKRLKSKDKLKII